jgi:hypothetical protein
MASCEGRIKDPLEIKIPEIHIEWTEKEDGMISNEIGLDLGILGKFTLGGPLTLDEMLTPDEKEEAEHEVHVAFARLLCRFATLAVIELDLGPGMLLGWYEHHMERLKGDPTVYHAIPESALSPKAMNEKIEKILRLFFGDQKDLVMTGAEGVKVREEMRRILALGPMETSKPGDPKESSSR